MFATYCLVEYFEIVYKQENGELQKKPNKWPRAYTGTVVKPIELCLLSDGIPLMRKCQYNSDTSAAEWEDMDYNDYQCIGYTNKENSMTFELHKIYKDIKSYSTGRSFTEPTTRIYNYLMKHPIHTVADLEISLSLLQVLTRSRDINVLPTILEIANVLLQTDEEVIFKFNQLSITTTSNLLTTLETYLNPMAKSAIPPRRCDMNFSDIKRFDTENIKVFFIRPMCSNISGIVVSTSEAGPRLNETSQLNYDLQYFYVNQSINDVLSQSNFELVAYVPQKLWNLVKWGMYRLKFSWYKNSNYFLDPSEKRYNVSGSALLVAVPGLKEFQPKYIPADMVDNNTSEPIQCFQWNQKIWEKSSDISEKSSYLQLCRRIRKPVQENQQATLTSTSHTTRFIRSIVSCILSLFGLFCILLTAIFFEHWRHQFSNKLLLNICVILLLVTTYFMLLNMPNVRSAIENTEHPRRCIAVGAFYQYSILVIFLWMLVIALLQYKRYVCVFAAKLARHNSVFYALAAWCLPLVPTILVVCLDSQSYTRYLSNADGNHYLCHPTGLSWIFGLLLPAAGIMLTCFAIFGYILWNIRRASKRFHLTWERADVIEHVRRSIILISVLSASWIFGLFGHMETYTFFEVLFCFTSTLQGFFLFIYFVVMDKSARSQWQVYLCNKRVN
ncbi:adhesion G-protein coupled receptor G2-like [Musca vetustissima]|uniref:adhesion G-protein coupled receptor G2-like n=1 Tax=Musca vetustissima TaxID=27455 RepID=UPI002AB5EE4E|nr:adhesion G-protein coupled receptor G2-like [Musca vetustissima]